MGPQDLGRNRGTWLGRILARKRRRRPPRGRRGPRRGEQLECSAHGSRSRQVPAGSPGRVVAARSRPAGVRAAELTPAPHPNSSRHTRPHVSESAGAMGELVPTIPLYLALFPQQTCPPSVVRLNILAWREGRREPGGPSKPIRCAPGRGGRELGAAPKRPVIPRPRAAPRRSLGRPAAQRGSGLFSRATPRRSRGRAPWASSPRRLRVGRPRGLPFALHPA